MRRPWRWQKNIKRNQAILSMRMQGVSIQDIAKKFGLTTQTIYNVLKVEKTKKVEVHCYCPKCGEDYVERIEESEAYWTGRGVWRRYCKNHKYLRKHNEQEYYTALPCEINTPF